MAREHTTRGRVVLLLLSVVEVFVGHGGDGDEEKDGTATCPSSRCKSALKCHPHNRIPTIERDPEPYRAAAALRTRTASRQLRAHSLVASCEQAIIVCCVMYAVPRPSCAQCLSSSLFHKLVPLGSPRTFPGVSLIYHATSPVHRGRIQSSHSLLERVRLPLNDACCQ